jgi:hypothetical protein
MEGGRATTDFNIMRRAASAAFSFWLQASPARATVQGGGKRRAGLTTIVCSWPPVVVELAGHRPTDQSSFFLRPGAP